jgi:phage terminase small subunit
MPRNSPKTPLKDRKLTPKEKALCHEYLIDKNGRQAAIRAGYSPNSAAEIAIEALNKPNVKAYLEALLSAQLARTGVTADKVINGLVAIAFHQARDILDIKNGKLTVKDMAVWSQASHHAVESVEVTATGGIKIRAASKVAAHKMLGDHFGLFTDFNCAIAAISRYGYVLPLENGEKGFVFREALPEAGGLTEGER